MTLKKFQRQLNLRVFLLLWLHITIFYKVKNGYTTFFLVEKKTACDYIRQLSIAIETGIYTNL